MMLNNSTASAAIGQAHALIESAQANYHKVLNGATNAQITLAQAQVTTAKKSLDNAKNNYTAVESQQKQLVKNAYNALLNSNLTPLPTETFTTTVPVLTGTYGGSQE